MAEFSAPKVELTFSLKKPLLAQMEDVTAMHHCGQCGFQPSGNGSSLSIHLSSVKTLCLNCHVTKDVRFVFVPSILLR